MTALRRIRTKAFGAALAAGMALSSAAVAQNSQQPVDVTAAPPPSADTVGPAQLRDFSLGGQASRPAPTADSTAPTQPAPVATQPSAVARPNTAAPERTSASPTADPAPANARPVDPQPQPVAGGETPANSRALPLDVVTPGSEPASDGPVAAAAPVEAATSPLMPQGLSPWPWLAALLAAIGAGAFWWWSRRHRSRRLADPGRMAFAGASAEDATLPPGPRGAVPQPRPESVPPAPVPPKPKSDGLITSSALRPKLELRFMPDRMVITDREAIVQFDLVIANVGGAAARSVLVEGLLVCASPVQDQEIAQFFQHPRGTGDRIPGIAAMDSLTLKSAVRLTLDKVKSFEAGGRTLFVPLVAFNLLYGANDQQVSASFLVGRGQEGDEKLAPFRLDMGPRIFRGLSARPHSSGLSTTPQPAGAFA